MAALDQSVLEFAQSIAESDIPAKLRCAACNKLAINAVRLPCCDQSLCQDCQASAQETCPVCMHSPVDLSTCKPNKALRLTIKAFLKSEEKKRSNKTVSTPIESVAAPTPAPEEQGTPVIENPPVISPKATASLEIQQQAAHPEQNGHAEGEHGGSIDAENAQVEVEAPPATEEDIEETGAGEDTGIEANDAQGDTGMDDVNNDESTDQESGPMSQSWPMAMGGGMNGFSGPMGMPNMGMQFPPGMFNNFGGMNMGNMGQGMGMGGFGWNGPQGMMSGPFGFFPNGGGYNQPYGSQMHQFSNQNFANQYRGRGNFRGRGRGGFRGGFRGNGNFSNHQGGMNMGNGPSQGQEDQSNWDQQPMSDDVQRAAGDEAQDEGRGTDAQYLDDASGAPGTGSVDPTAREAGSRNDELDQNVAMNSDGRGESGFRADTPPAARNVPINAPTGPKAMRMGFANTHQGRLSSQAAEHRPSLAQSDGANHSATPEAETRGQIPTGPKHANGHSDDRDRSRARHSVRESFNGDDREISKSGRARSRSRTPADRSRRHRPRDDERRHEESSRSGDHSQRNERTDEDVSRVRSRRTSKDRRSRSRSPGDRDRRRNRRERSARRHRDSSREDRHRRRRSTSRGDYDRDSKRSRREKDEGAPSRRERDRDRDRRREREREQERPRERDRERERLKDVPNKPRSRSPAPRRQSDAPPADDIGFRIKGSRGRRESAADPPADPPTGPKKRETAAPPTGPKAMDADPYALEREKRMQERMQQHEQRRRDGAHNGLGKRDREDDEGGARRRRGRR